MAVRRFFRGTVEWDRLEAVGHELLERTEEPTLRIEFLEADNWLSTPFVANDRWFVKVITRQNALVQAIFTGARNLGAFSSGTEGFFESYGTPLAMARHEFEATRRMRAIGVNAPEPIEAFEVEGLGVLVLEYIPEFRTVGDLDPNAVMGIAPDLFRSLSTMHSHGLVHGDLRSENVLVKGGEIYFIDATNVREDGLQEARAYDLASALGALAPIIGASDAVEVALEHYGSEDLLDAREFLDFVNIRPDHDFNGAAVKGEIEKRASYRSSR